MGPIAELAAPLLAPMLQPIMQDVEKAVGGVIGQAGQGIQGLIGQAMQAFNPLQALMGGFQNQGLCPATPNPFSTSGLPPGILNNFFNQLPRMGAAGNGSGGVSGNDWANMAANASGGQSYQQLNSALQQAEQSGDPAQVAAAQANISRYDNFVEMMSNAEKKQDDTLQALIANLK